MLRLQTESRSVSIHLFAFAFRRAVQEITAVKLNARLRGRNLQHAVGDGFLHSSRELNAGSIQHPIVVVALAQVQLLIVRGDPRADGLGLSKVERRSRDVTQFASRNQSGIDRREPIRV